MRIAVTGRYGQIAQSLLECAAARGVDVQVAARPEVDLSRPSDVADAVFKLRPDAIVNAAAYGAVDRAESEPELAYRINMSGAEAVADAAARLGVPVIQLSTDYVFDGGLDRAYREDDPTHPLGVYGDSKLRGERAVAAAHRDHVILRTAWVYSPFGRNFARSILVLAGQQDMIPVVGDQRGAPTDALDLADAIIKVARNLCERATAAELRGVFHITGGGSTNRAEFATAILAASAAAGGPSARVVPVSTSQYPALARRPANSVLDTTRLADLHGIKLPDWRQSLQGCIGRLLAAR